MTVQRELLTHCGSRSDLRRRIVEGVGRANSSLPFLKKVMSFVSRLRPSLVIDPSDGAPKITVDALAADAPVVILVDVDKSAFIGTHGAMPFYEGASRARQKLVVFASMTAADCSEVVNAFAQDGRAKSMAEGDQCALERMAELFHLHVNLNAVVENHAETQRRRETDMKW